MNKRGQLIQLEFQYFIYGFITGIIGSLILVFLGNKEIIPFKIPWVCKELSLLPLLAFSPHKKGQLGLIELRFFFTGFFIGLIGGLILVGLGRFGVLPFQIPLVCG